MDERLWQAQAVYAEIQELERQPDRQALPAKFAALAGLREERALTLLKAGRDDGWVDLFTAVTAWGRAGAKAEAKRLLTKGRRLAARLGRGRENVEAELRELGSWLDQLPPVPPPPQGVRASGRHPVPRPV